VVRVRALRNVFGVIIYVLEEFMKRTIGFILAVFIVAGLSVSYLVYNGYIWLNNPSINKFSIRGIDISVHQKEIDWKEVQKNNFQFVFIKATEGMDFKDTYFQENWINAGNIGLKRGAYHFLTFRSSGKDQAKNFIDSVPKEDDCLPPVIDIEFGGNSKAIPARDKFKKELSDFITIIEDYYKKKPIFYVTYEAYDKYITGDYEDYKIWIRDIIKYPGMKDNREWIFWQYSSRGRVKGFSTFVDLNVFKGEMKDFEKLLLEQNY
jgi:lysozyme